MKNINDIQKVGKQLEEMSKDYNSATLWGSAPDGDVKFNDLMEWIVENDNLVEYMLSVAKKIKSDSSD